MPLELVAVVDDEPQILQVLEAVLSFKGVPSSLHGSAEALLDVVKPIDGRLWLRTDDGRSACLKAVVLDMNLPGMSGADLATALRRLQPNLKIVMITAALPEQLQAHALDLEGVVVVRKPFRLETLEQALRDA